MSQIIIPWLEAKDHIKEADVLLFRAPGFPSIGWGITAYTGGIHSHVALAHRDGRHLYCVEQREFKGGRSVLLEKQVIRHKNQIDVYRADSTIFVPTVEYDRAKPHAVIEWSEKHLTEEMAREIVGIALSMTGDDYGWRNIWEIFKCYAPGFRLVKKPKADVNGAKAYVCSTLVTYSFRKIYGDPCPNLSDTRTAPADIAQSAMFHYLFTIGL
jgi:hypothetical protein